MIATHYGTPAAVDARVREEFVEHLCLVNEDFNHEKRALLEENDALAAENVTLRKEADLYRAAEETQIALRQKADEREAALAAHVEALTYKGDWLASSCNSCTCDDVGVQLDHWEAAKKTLPKTSLDSRDKIKQAEALPDNLISHRNAWLDAIKTLAKENDGLPDEQYWLHEMKAMQDMYADLDEKLRQAEQC